MRPQTVHIYGGADAGTIQVGVWALVYVRAGNELRGKHVEIELTPRTVCGQDAAIQRYRVELRPEATNRHTIANTTDAVNRDAGQSLQRLRDVLVRHLAQILAGNRIDRVDGFLLDIDGLPLTTADAGDNDLLDRRRRQS